MPQADNTIEGLTVAGCFSRQQRLVDELQSSKSGASAALICDRRHVYYFSGYWSASHHAPVMLITDEGRSFLVLPDTVEDANVAAKEVYRYSSHQLGTLVDDQFAQALKPLAHLMTSADGLGVDLPQLAMLHGGQMQDLSDTILKLRRAKDEDEAVLVRHAVRACEAAYARAGEILRPGVREIDVFAEMQCAAVKEVGEPIGEMGNDFQSGTLGGPPRPRRIEQGELMPLDVAISVRGYRCDLCRTFAIGGEPTGAQREAADLVTHAIQCAEEHIRLGGSCRELYETVNRQLDGVNGWRFFHHLGHGTGLSAHEAPRLNPYSNDQFQVGDLFTIEPGLYHEELRAGLRIEQNYWMSPTGLCRLSNYPTSL